MAKFSLIVMWLNIAIGAFGLFLFILLVGSAGEFHWMNLLTAVANFVIAYVLHKQQS